MMLRSVKEQKRHRRTVRIVAILLAAILGCAVFLIITFLRYDADDVQDGSSSMTETSTGLPEYESKSSTEDDAS